MHTLGEFFGKIFNKKTKKNTYSWIMCVSYTRITGNVKSQHKQYDHWHSQDFSTWGQSEGRVWDHGREIFEKFAYQKDFFCTLKDLLYPSFSIFV